MKESKTKNEHYSNLKMVLRIVTLGVAIWALVVSYQNKQAIKWLEDENDNLIERLMFPEIEVVK